MRNHFSSALDNNTVVDAKIFSFDVVGVMKSCLPNSGSIDLNRLENPIGIYTARASYVDADIQQGSFALFSWEFISYGLIKVDFIFLNHPY